MAVSGLFLDSQIETKSGSPRSGGQRDPASGTWSNEASNSFGHDVTNIRKSNGAGNYSHDRYGFEVSGAITVANENNYRMHHSTTHVYVDGNLSSDITGDRYTESSTRSMHSSNGGGFDHRTIASGGPLVNHLGETTGSNSSNTTLDHIASEVNLRDNRTQDRSDWRFDVDTGNLVPTQRVQVNSHVIDVSLDLIRDTTGEREIVGNFTSNFLDYEFDGESQWQNRETISSGQRGSATVTRTTPLEGAGAGVTMVMITGTDAVAHSSYDTLTTLSGVYNDEVSGGGGYYRFQSSNDDETRTSVRILMT
jgi:hypothetical protein